MRRSGAISSRGCWHGPSWPPWPSTRLDDVLVVSPDREVLRRASAIGARTLRQRSRGLNAGLREARADVVAGGATAILVLPIDLPFVTTEAIEIVPAPLASVATAREARPGPTVVLVSDRHGHRHQCASGCDRPMSSTSPSAATAGGRIEQRPRTAGAAWIELDGPLTVDLDTADDLVFVESAQAGRRAALDVG